MSMIQSKLRELIGSTTTNPRTTSYASNLDRTKLDLYADRAGLSNIPGPPAPPNFVSPSTSNSSAAPHFAKLSIDTHKNFSETDINKLPRNAKASGELLDIMDHVNKNLDNNHSTTTNEKEPKKTNKNRENKAVII